MYLLICVCVSVLYGYIVFSSSVPSVILRSWSEYQSPSRCNIAEACPGVSTTPTPGTTNLYADTQMCAEGYSGVRCSSCEDDWYQLQGRCYLCGSSVDQRSTIVLTVLVGVSAMVLLATAAATLKSTKLAVAVQLFTLAQGTASVGVAGAANSPLFTKQLQQAFTYLNFINFGQQDRGDIHTQIHQTLTCTLTHDISRGMARGLHSDRIFVCICTCVLLCLCVSDHL